PQATPKPDKRKGKVTDADESPPKLVKALTKVCPNPDAPMLVPYEIHGKMYQLAEEQIQAQLYKEEKLEKAAREVRLSKPELIKVVHEEATKLGVDLKVLSSEKGGVTELDKLGPIIQKKKNKVVGELMTSLGKRYARLKVIPEELGINPTLPAPRQVLSLTSGRKRKQQELEPEVHTCDNLYFTCHYTSINSKLFTLKPYVFTFK
ncbi:hypothetical protein Tco_0048488, partial [Tanacetum coccineum]